MEITPCRKPWKGSMTARERFNAQMHYKPFDRTVNIEFGYWAENYETWSIFKKNGITNEGQANQYFAFDDALDWVWLNTWLNPCFESKVISETETTRIIMNGEGLLAEVPKDGHDTIPHYIKASIVTPDDWKRCKEERLRRDDPARKLDAAWMKSYPAVRDRARGIYCGSMIGLIRNMLTFEGLAYACYDYPDMVEDMVETSCVLVEDMLDQILPYVEFDYAAGWEDICFKNGPIISLDFFDNVVVPRYERIGRKLRKAGIDIWFTDCDGDVRPLIPGFLKAGINCLWPFEVMGGGHPADLLNEFGQDLRIMGGFDKIQMIKGKEAIKAYMKTLVPLVERGGFIPFCDHRCPPDVNENDYLYYLDLKEQMFGLASVKSSMVSAD